MGYPGGVSLFGVTIITPKLTKGQGSIPRLRRGVKLNGRFSLSTDFCTTAYVSIVPTAGFAHSSRDRRQTA